MKNDLKLICDALDFNKKNLRYIIKNKKLSKIGIDAIYSVNYLKTKIPLIYFKKMDCYDEQLIIDLHKKVWNEGKSPFLIIILTNRIYVYNSFVPPTNTKDKFNEKVLIKRLKLFNTVKENFELIKNQLNSLSRKNLESLSFWDKKELKFNHARRIDLFIIDNLRKLRERLSDRLKFDVINNLVGRSIFISYLQDKGAIDGLFNQINNNCNSYIDILKSKDDTYKLFNKISELLNGDAFPVDKSEKENVNEKDLEKISFFLRGAYFDNNSYQLSLNPYRFDFIPIEFISSIYEEFLGSEDKKKGAHYTPPNLATLVINEFFDNVSLLGKKIIDVSCGSGIFLVETYGRIINEWIKKNKKEIDWDTLIELLTEHIYGVDINESAVRVTIFSLYLRILEYANPKEGKKLPKLFNKNLFKSDFFDDKPRFNKIGFDFFIGNPPWSEEKKDSLAVNFCKKNNYSISRNQLAQAFIWKIKKIAKEDSKSCLILPSKSILFNTSNPSLLFRKNFFKEHNIRLIINLSALRHFLFNNAVGPSIIAFYSFEKETKKTLYVSPKISLENNNSPHIYLNQNDFASISKELRNSKVNIWKITMWGSIIDFEIMRKINQNKTLLDISKKLDFIMGEGLQFTGDHNKEPRLYNMKLIKTNNFDKFYLDISSTETIKRNIFHRPKTNIFEIFLKPHLLIRKNVLQSAFIDKDIAFTHSIFGIHGDKKILKYISSIINSDLIRYYFFFSLGSWGVERDYTCSNELKTMPIPKVDDKTLSKLEKLYDVITNKKSKGKDVKNDLDKLNNFIYEIYSINDFERRIIEDTLKYNLSIFTKGINSISYKKVNKSLAKNYLEIFLNHVNNFLGLNNKFINAKLYYSKNSLSLITLIIENKKKEIELIDSGNELNNELKRVEKSIKEKYSDSIYSIKNLKLFSDKTIDLTKSNEQRFWTFKQAIIDANELISEVID